MSQFISPVIFFFFFSRSKFLKGPGGVLSRVPSFAGDAGDFANSVLDVSGRGGVCRLPLTLMQGDCVSSVVFWFF